MTTYRIDADRQSRTFRDEMTRLEAAGLSPEPKRRAMDWLLECARQAERIPGGFVKKIVWDAEGGYPEHAWGYPQYSPRPYRPGYGCDGTTDGNIHLIAAIVCERLGIDYAAAYAEAYSHDSTLAGTREWLNDLRRDPEVAAETLVPEGTSNAVVAGMLHDLREINHHNLAGLLEDILEAKRETRRAR
jgi:hypothetical protein